jgi:hypothetical protein
MAGVVTWALAAVAVVLGLVATWLWLSLRRTRAETGSRVHDAAVATRRTAGILAVSRDGILVHAPDGRVL